MLCPSQDRGGCDLRHLLHLAAVIARLRLAEWNHMPRCATIALGDRWALRVPVAALSCPTGIRRLSLDVCSLQATLITRLELVSA